MTIAEFITANLARIEQDRCSRVEITNDPVTIGGRLVQYVGMSGDYHGTYIQVADLDAERRLLPEGRITRYLTPEEADEFRAQCPPSVGAIEARRWVAAIRAVVAEVTGWHHEVVEDCWYTCAAATEEREGGECCDDSRRGGACDCGRDYRAQRILAPIAAIWAGQDGWQEEWR